MTTTDERIDALIMAENVLSDMLEDKSISWITKESIRAALHHYPWPIHINALRNNPPESW